LIGVTDVLHGLKPDGSVLINTTKAPEDVTSVKWNSLATVDATGVALRHGLGTESAPIVNTAIIGAFARLCPQVPIDSIVESILKAAPSRKQENADAAREAFDMVKGVV
ncbi:MAG: 2-oxoacid:acceptor oxidoreductase family protein, partial [Methanomassiliicoccales archaeon]|nr:2-oxoacid:acceptor oxidoreductase family protein [Methanomassiliicoccales archaeon]